MPDDPSLTRARLRMVEDQLSSRDIWDGQVLEVMRTVPRHRFVPLEHLEYAYHDGPLPIGEGQTISQPYIVALMTQLLNLSGKGKVLEIGTGSGYQTAILSYLAREVYSIERFKSLAERATAILGELGLTNVRIHIGDGSNGWPEAAPYEAIIVTAAAPRVPPPLLEQLMEGGRLVLPVGGRGGQFLERWIRRGNKHEHEQIAPVAFVPLIGALGWDEEKWEWF
jgi:protein-L-isoaspartate(D-aspartate) O-methyltransferase